MDCFTWLKEKKEAGLVRHMGFSYHDDAEFLDQVLQEHPEMEFVQLQINYLDWDSEKVQSRKCYEVARRHGVPVIVMEPVKGGKLADLPAPAKEIFDTLGGGSPASYAIRYAASFEGVMMVLSGMSTLEQMQDNLSYMTDFVPLNEVEFAAVERVREILKCQETIPCTNCRYCVDGCPAGIDIPGWFGAYNAHKQGQNMEDVCGGTPGDCVACRACEGICPQNLEIRALLKKVAEDICK